VDISARLGDNELAIILPESDEEAAKTVVSRIVEELQKIEVISNDTCIKADFSTSIAALSEKIKTKDDLLKISLSTLSAAKKSGHGAVFTAKDSIRKIRLLERIDSLLKT